MKDDYPEWTRYSSGNPHGWRRIYQGQLLYAFDGTNGRGCSWMEPDGTMHDTASFEEAKREAEAWADVAAGPRVKGN